MLDKNDNRIIHQYPNKVVIEEKRAPTDESVSLLREMEKAATEQIVKSFVFGSENAVSGSVVYIDTNPRSADLSVRTIFNLNGKDYSAETKVSRLDLKFSARDAYAKLIDAISAEISLGLHSRIGAELLKYIEK